MKNSVVCLFLAITCSSLGLAFSEESKCKAWLVQSIPTDMPNLRHVAGVLPTGDVLQWLAGNSSKSLDILAQYWQLVAAPDNPQSGDYGYTATQLHHFGAPVGRSVFNSLKDAVARKVNMRIIQHSGVAPDYDQESAELAAGHENVKNVTLLLKDWWGNGIVHAKVWISDQRDVYIGSANNDWKSLTQVKELGIYILNCPMIARNVEIYFNNLWTLATLNASSYTKTVWDNEWQIRRKVPCWSHFVTYGRRCRSPLPRYVETPNVLGYPCLVRPTMFHMPLDTSSQQLNRTRDQSSYLSFSPPELSFYRHQTDLQGWVDTIKSVPSSGTLRISTMDWLGQSQYLKPTVYWSTLSSAISEVVFSKGATVRLLVAYWAHFINNTEQYLESLLYSNRLCTSSAYNKCHGKIEIKYYIIPGYNLTGAAIKDGKPTGNIYPGYSRVNHGKYAVSDIRAQIGTSNLVWDYFHNTAGVSFGTYEPSIVSKVQEVFDADWESPYAVSVKLPLDIE